MTQSEPLTEREKILLSALIQAREAFAEAERVSTFWSDAALCRQAAGKEKGRITSGLFRGLVDGY